MKKTEGHKGIFAIMLFVYANILIYVPSPFSLSCSSSILLYFACQCLQLNHANGPPSPQPAAGNTGRVAAVGPYIQVPVPSRPDNYIVPPDPLKPQTLGMNTSANHARSKSGQSLHNNVLQT